MNLIQSSTRTTRGVVPSALAFAIALLPVPVNALACGTDNTASGTQSTAVGNNNTASGFNSTAVGSVNDATGNAYAGTATPVVDHGVGNVY